MLVMLGGMSMLRGVVCSEDEEPCCDGDGEGELRDTVRRLVDTFSGE